MDPFIGEIRPFPYNFAPQGWLYCDGSLVQISDYDVLYTLLGTTYGGDGVSTFGLPDLRGRVPMGAGTGAGSTGTIGQQGGAESVRLTSQQVPLHSHLLVASGSGTSNSPANNHPGLAAVLTYGSATGSLAADAISPSGAPNGPHANIQPYLAIAFCISYLGVFPSQP